VPTTNTPLVAVELIAACIWVGSLVCLAIVANVVRSVLDGPSQVTFFRVIGRRYTFVGTGSLLVAIGTGLVLAWPPSSWSGTIDAAVALAGVLVLTTAVGMAQARAMTIRRRRAMSTPEDHDAGRAVRRGRLLAGALRGALNLGEDPMKSTARQSPLADAHRRPPSMSSNASPFTARTPLGHGSRAASPFSHTTRDWDGPAS
jgi:hypothetical protein